MEGVGDLSVEVGIAGAGQLAGGIDRSGGVVFDGGAAAALACLEETRRLAVNENAAARGAELYDGCRGLLDKHEIVGDVRGGHGLMVALELVSDRASKTPIDKDSIGKIFETAYQNGVMIRISGPNIILSPPLVLTASDVSQIVTALDQALAEV